MAEDYDLPRFGSTLSDSADVDLNGLDYSEAYQNISGSLHQLSTPSNPSYWMRGLLPDSQFAPSVLIQEKNRARSASLEKEKSYSRQSTPSTAPYWRSNISNAELEIQELIGWESGGSNKIGHLSSSNELAPGVSSQTEEEDGIADESQEDQVPNGTGSSEEQEEEHEEDQLETSSQEFNEAAEEVDQQAIDEAPESTVDADPKHVRFAWWESAEEHIRKDHPHILHRRLDGEKDVDDDPESALARTESSSVALAPTITTESTSEFAPTTASSVSNQNVVAVIADTIQQRLRNNAPREDVLALVQALKMLIGEHGNDETIREVPTVTETETQCDLSSLTDSHGPIGQLSTTETDDGTQLQVVSTSSAASAMTGESAGFPNKSHPRSKSRRRKERKKDLNKVVLKGIAALGQLVGGGKLPNMMQSESSVVRQTSSEAECGQHDESARRVSGPGSDSTNESEKYIENLKEELTSLKERYIEQEAWRKDAEIHLKATIVTLTETNRQKEEIEKTLEMYHQADLERGNYIVQLQRDSSEKISALELCLRQGESERRELQAKIVSLQRELADKSKLEEEDSDEHQKLKKTVTTLDELTVRQNQDIVDLLGAMKAVQKEKRVLAREVQKLRGQLEEIQHSKGALGARRVTSTDPLNVRSGEDFYSRGTQHGDSFTVGEHSYQGGGTYAVAMERIQVLEEERDSLLKRLKTARYQMKLSDKALGEARTRLEDQQGVIERQKEKIDRQKRDLDVLNFGVQCEEAYDAMEKGTTIPAKLLRRPISTTLKSKGTFPSANNAPTETTIFRRNRNSDQPRQTEPTLECPMHSTSPGRLTSSESCGGFTETTVATGAPISSIVLGAEVPKDGSLEKLSTVDTSNPQSSIESIRLPPRPIAYSTSEDLTTAAMNGSRHVTFSPDVHAYPPSTSSASGSNDPVPSGVVKHPIPPWMCGATLAGPLNRFLPTHKPFRRTAEMRKRSSSLNSLSATPPRQLTPRGAVYPTGGTPTFGMSRETSRE